MDISTLLAWETAIGLLVNLGVKSWDVIKAAMSDAGADDETIEALKPKWDALVDDVRRSAGL